MTTKMCWWLLAAIHAVPAAALFMPSLVTRLYGVEGGSTVFLLLHHRAALFAVVVVVCVWAALRAEVRPLAVAAVGLSMLSFLLLYALAGQPGALRAIAVADLLGLPFLAWAAWAAYRPAAA